METQTSMDELLLTVNQLNERIDILEGKSSNASTRARRQQESDRESKQIHAECLLCRSEQTYTCVYIAWIIYSLVCLGLLVIHTYSATEKYLSYPVQTKYTLRHLDEIKLPDITICSLNPIKKSRLVENPDLKGLYNNLTVSNPSDVKIGGSQTEYQTFLDRFWRLPVKERKNLGYQSSDLYFRDINNFQNERKTITTYKYGNCFTDTIAKPQNRPGYQNGYAVSLNINIDEYLWTGMGHGAAIFVQEPGTKPSLTGTSFTIHPGQTGYIKLRPRRIRKLREPFGQCSYRKAMVNMTEYTYSTAGCKDMCYIEKMMAMCGCVHPSRVTLINTELNVCNLTDARQTNCTGDDELIIEACDCPMSCDQMMYSPAYTVENRVSQGAVEKSVGILCGGSKIQPIFANSTNCLNSIKSNIAMIYMYVQDLLLEEIVEEPEVTLAALMAGISGIMGFISLLTLVIIGLYYVRNRCRPRVVS